MVPSAIRIAQPRQAPIPQAMRSSRETWQRTPYSAAAAATVLTNPPYGERLGDAGEAAALAKTLGQVWQRHPAQGLYAITADADFEQHFGKKAARRRKIYNGMIPCQLYMYFEQPKREKR